MVQQSPAAAARRPGRALRRAELGGVREAVGEVRANDRQDAETGRRRGVWGVTGSFGGTHGFEYITGVEVSDLDKVPAKFRRLTIPAQRYAIFVHNGHVSKIHETMYAIKKEWLPKWMVPGRTDTRQ